MVSGVSFSRGTAYKARTPRAEQPPSPTIEFVVGAPAAATVATRPHCTRAFATPGGVNPDTLSDGGGGGGNNGRAPDDTDGAAAALVSTSAPPMRRGAEGGCLPPQRQGQRGRSKGSARGESNVATGESNCLKETSAMKSL